MNHRDIVFLVNSMDVRDLNAETFVDFVHGAQALFMPKGARFQKYFSPGYNDNSKDTYDWSSGKPEFRSGEIVIFDRIEFMERKDEGKRWINVHFRNEARGYEDTGVWGISPEGLPLRFGFDPEHALYIAELSFNGTPNHPWQDLYVKLA